jgi:DNA repair exonuclease SbcCD ATPase subunit
MQPAKKTPSVLRAEAATLEENISIARSLIRYREDLIRNAERLKSEAEEAVQKAIAKRDEIVRRIDEAPAIIDGLHQDIDRMKKARHRITVTPKLEKLQALKAKIAEMEADLES